MNSASASVGPRFESKRAGTGGVISARPLVSLPSNSARLVLARDCHGLLYPAGYSRRVQQGTGTGWVYPTLALPVPPAGGWQVGGGSAHSNSARKVCQRSTQTTSDASYVGKFSYLFLIFLPTTQAHEGPQRPMKANAGQRKPTAANDGQQWPTKCCSYKLEYALG